MKNTHTPVRERSLLAVIDVQEKLLPAIPRKRQVLQNVQFLLQAANLLGVPVLISEQYPEGLGPTAPEIQHLSQSAHFVQKIHFSAGDLIASVLKEESDNAATDAEASDVQDHSLFGGVRDQVILCGIETHICVSQTALQLISQDIQTFVIDDAVGSRHRSDHKSALRRLQATGCLVTSCESLVFEWCQRAGTDTFRELSRMVKARDQSKFADEAKP